MGWGRGQHSSRGERAWTGPESQTELFRASCLTSALTSVGLGGRGGPCWAQAGGRHSEPGGLAPAPQLPRDLRDPVCLRVSFLLGKPEAHRHLQRRLEGGQVMLPVPSAPCGVHCDPGRLPRLCPARLHGCANRSPGSVPARCCGQNTQPAQP